MKNKRIFQIRKIGLKQLDLISSLGYLVFRKFSILILLMFFIAIDINKVQAAEQPLIFSDDFGITGYYSPMEDQKYYLMGDVKAEKILNGNGIVGADNTPVFLGMIAAPREIPFGTKIYIPGIGLGEVHDRGGAIQEKRLDVWMGSGDAGLQRAINWGKKNKRVTFYLPGAKVPEALLSRGVSDSYLFSDQTVSEARIAQLQRYNGVDAKKIISPFKTLKEGMKSEEVKIMQKNLKFLGLYKGPTSGYFGNQTRTAIVDFQLTQQVIDSEDDPSAGYFGPRTHEQMMKLMEIRNITPADKDNPEPKQTDQVMVAEKEKNNKLTLIQTAFAGYEPLDDQYAIFQEDLTLGTRSPDVQRLHEVLAWAGIGVKEPGDYYSLQTAENVFHFQQKYQLVKDKDQRGAGVFGPRTRTELEKLVQKIKQDYTEIGTTINHQK